MCSNDAWRDAISDLLGGGHHWSAGTESTGRLAGAVVEVDLGGTLSRALAAGVLTEAGAVDAPPALDDAGFDACTR